MKTIKILTMTLLFALQAAACACNEDDKVITFDELPAAAQAFISKYFGDKQVSLVKKDKEGLRTYYDVMLTDGTKLEFDKKGEWREIESKSNGVTTELVPAEINKKKKKNYPSQRILQIDRSNSIIEIELSNRLELKFNKRFELIGFDD